MPRWESLVLNKVYKTEFFSLGLLIDDPPQIMQLLEQYTNFSKLEVKDEDKQIVSLLDQSLDGKLNSSEIFQILIQISTKVSQLNSAKSEQFNYLDVISFSSISRCRIWPKIFKEFRGVTDKQYINLKNIEEQKQINQIDRKQKKSSELDPLLDWYIKFLNTFKQELEWKFDKTILSVKQVKMIEKRQQYKKAHLEFFDALRKVDFEKIKKIIDRDGIAHIMECSDNDNNQKKATHVACQSGSLELVKFLDQYEIITWNELDEERQSPLFDAVTAGAFDIIQYLGDVAKVDLDHRECQERTAFYSACYLGQFDTIKYLYTKGVDINSQSILKRTPLTKACYLNQVPVVQWLLKCQNINFMQQDVKGRTALHNASWGPAGGKYGKKKGDIYLPDSPESAQSLLECGHPVDLADFDGNTSLQSATSSRGIQCVRILMKFGADREHQNKYGETPLFQAARYGHTDMVQELALTYHCSITTPDNKGMNPMVSAVVFGFHETYQMLAMWLLNTNPLINYKTQLPIQTDVRYEGEEQLKMASQVRPIIDINYVIQTCKAYEKNQYALEFIQFLITQVQGKNYQPDLFYHSEENIYDHILNTYLSIENRELLFLLLKFLLTLIEQSDGQLIDQFKLKLINTFLQNGKLSLLHFIIKENLLSLETIIENDLINPENILYGIMRHLDSNKPDDQISDSQLSTFIAYFNKNVIISSNKCNLLHILVKHRRIKIIIDILAQSYQQIYMLLQDKNDKELTPVQLARVMKSSDICHLFEQFSHDDNKLIVDGQYQIPIYKVSLIQQEEPNIILTNDTTDYIDIYQQNLCLLSQDGKYTNFQNYQQSKFNSSNFYLIDRLDQVDECIAHLNTCSLIAIDVEFFLEQMNITFICTIQLSTIYNTYIIDALKLKDWLSAQDCPLRSILLDNKKIKLFHGCDNDLRWLASNYGYLVCGLYDTSRAESMIQISKSCFGLQQLTQQYFNLSLDKSFQRADWRIRPLPNVMVNYAREDSECLILLFFTQLKLLSPAELLKLNLVCSDLSHKSYHKHVTQHILLQVEDI